MCIGNDSVYSSRPYSVNRQYDEQKNIFMSKLINYNIAKNPLPFKIQKTRHQDITGIMETEMHHFR